jgi:lactoylglutathione lyase
MADYRGRFPESEPGPITHSRRRDFEEDIPVTSATSATEYDPKQWVWGTDYSKPRFLHTMLRVKDLGAALRFYIDGLGMKQLGDRFDVPVRRVTAVFIGFEDYAAGGCLELVHYWDSEGPYTHGTGYGHISIGVPDVEAMLVRLEAMGAEVTLRPAVLIAGGPKVAFLKDLDGYSVELLQTNRS